MPRERIVLLDPAKLEVFQHRDSLGGSGRTVDTKLLRRVISERLTERQREYVSDYYFGKLTIYEIAITRGTSPSTVSRTLKRARGRIFDSLKYTVMR